MIRWDAFTVIQTNKSDEEGRPINHWIKLGKGFKNRDGSISILLNALPINRKIILREERKEDEAIPFDDEKMDAEEMREREEKEDVVDPK